MKPGDLVRVKKTVINGKSTVWFKRFAETKVPMLVLPGNPKDDYEGLGAEILKCLRPDGTVCYINSSSLTKKF